VENTGCGCSRPGTPLEMGIELCKAGPAEPGGSSPKDEGPDSIAGGAIVRPGAPGHNDAPNHQHVHPQAE